MDDTSLQDRLRDHAKAFDGLLSLIPAKMYYGEEKTDQWQKKKQTKDQAKAAKRGKLDPDSELNRSAKEVLEERARNKRKLKELEAEDESDNNEEDEDDNIILDVEKEKPGEGLKKKKAKDTPEDEPSPKKVKVAKADAQEVEASASASKAMTPKEEKRLAKKLKKEEKKKAKVENTSSKPKVADPAPADSEAENDEPVPIKPSTEADAENDGVDDDMAPIDVSGLVGEDHTSPESTPDSPVFDNNSGAEKASVDAASTTTSIASAVPPSEKPRYIKIPADTTALRARLEAKIESLRAARKAVDEEGVQIRTRQELIEARREKQAQRRAHKRELRAKAKEEEDKKREEALASSRNSPMSMLSPMFNDPDDDRNANHFAFGRLAFSDGTQMSHDLSYTKSTALGDKKRGASDPKTALAKLEAQKKRLASLDDDKRKEVLEKETWLAARRRAEGEKVQDNEALLKKAVKRKDTAKKKSEREWKERSQGVQKSIKDKQKKREDNLRKRREEKGSQKGKKGKGVATKSKSRPGFEGGFGGGKKK